MSGEWATAADARVVLPHCGLAQAAAELAHALTQGQREPQRDSVLVASAIIRRERKRLGNGLRHPDMPTDSIPSDALLWSAINMASGSQLPSISAEWRLVYLRAAEAALREWWRRNGS